MLHLLGKYLSRVCDSRYNVIYLGAHKDHEVKLIKKAIAQVKTEYMEIVARASDSQNSMNKLKEGFLRLIKETNDRYAR